MKLILRFEFLNFYKLILLFALCVFFFSMFNCEQSKIQSLAGQHSDILESLSPNVRKRVEVLREIQV